MNQHLLNCLTLLGTSLLRVVDAFWAAMASISTAASRALKHSKNVGMTHANSPRTSGSAFLLFAFCFLLSAFSAVGQATVSTDKSDYPPGSTAIITGRGFQPGEAVQCQVLRIDINENSGPEHDPWQVTADDN